jgi:mono/diheme cytochrome c family protein
MQRHSSSNSRCLRAAFLFLTCLGGGHFFAPTATAGGAPAAIKLYGQYCAKCHDADGSGKSVRDDLPKIPDFTDVSWQSRRSDAQLVVSILDGKGALMPSFRGKVDEPQARALVTHVRTFAPAARKSTPKRQQEPQQPAEPTLDSLEDRLRALQQEFDELREQFRRLSDTSRSANPFPKVQHDHSLLDSQNNGKK